MNKSEPELKQEFNYPQDYLRLGICLHRAKYINEERVKLLIKALESARNVGEIRFKTNVLAAQVHDQIEVALENFKGKK